MVQIELMCRIYAYSTIRLGWYLLSGVQKLSLAFRLSWGAIGRRIVVTKRVQVAELRPEARLLGHLAVEHGAAAGGDPRAGASDGGSPRADALPALRGGRLQWRCRRGRTASTLPVDSFRHHDICRSRTLYGRSTCNAAGTQPMLTWVSMLEFSPWADVLANSRVCGPHCMNCGLSSDPCYCQSGQHCTGLSLDS